MRLKLIIFEDDLSWCCKVDNDYNIVESACGFGDTPEEALKNFAHDYFYTWEECI